ncbi:MAG: peroxidase family protein [Pseudomonadota bacterium]
MSHGSSESVRGLYENDAKAAKGAVRAKTNSRGLPERGRFGRLFPLGTIFRDGAGKRRRLQAHSGDVRALRELGASEGPMHSKRDADNRDSLMPAGYTFLGQFVDHDVTFDTVSSLDKPIRDEDTENARTATLDLDSVYGGGPERSPFLYRMPYLLVGAALAGGRYDLLRRTTVSNAEAAAAQPAPPKVKPVATPKAQPAPKPAAQASDNLNAAFSSNDGADDVNDILGIGGAPTPKPKQPPKAVEPPKQEAPKAEQPQSPPPRYARPGVTRDVALIGDPRNDENVVISQMQAGFIAFHNRMVDLLLEKDGIDLAALDADIANAPTLLDRRKAEERRHKVEGDIFERARRHTVHYYHRMLVEDFLPRVLGINRVASIRENGRQFYFPKGFRNAKTGGLITPFIPVEFSVAAYRYGHAQVRNSYALSGQTQGVPLFGSGAGPDGIDMMGFKPISRPLMIDWRYFFPYDGADGLVQLSRPINTSLPDALFKLVEGGIVPPGAVASLASRNLNRGRIYNLPSGQALARVMKIPSRDIVAADLHTRTILKLRETPLWYYILQESKQQGVEAHSSGAHAYLKAARVAKSSLIYKASVSTDTQQAAAVKSATGSKGGGGDILGPVGGTIVGEVLLGLIDHYREATGAGLDFASELDNVMSSTKLPDGGQVYQMRDLLKDAGVAGAIK